jgi:cytochrome oxidase Cu insertion factor (SCO1/SenC/PrrC family)
MDDAYLGLASLAVVGISSHLWIRALKRVAIPKNRAVFASTFFLLTVAIGSQKVTDDAIEVGATIPSFTATDEHGQTFDSQSLAGHPALIKFFRGHW